MAQKKATKTKKSKKKTNSINYILLGFVFLVILAVFYHYRHGIKIYACTKFSIFCSGSLIEANEKMGCKSSNRTISRNNIRNIELIDKYQENIFGIDVSQYQGNISWNDIVCVEDMQAIQFVIIRATAGSDKVDSSFDYNWKETRKNKIIRGAYHYYRPDEDPVDQANNFVQNVNLKSGDLPPILDIEVDPKVISHEQLFKNIKIWMALVENHYKMKPILYSGQKFHEKHLIHYFGDYPLWIANYNFFVEKMKPEWMMWQFTEKGYVNGIKTPVDVNMFQGSYEDLVSFTKK